MDSTVFKWATAQKLGREGSKCNKCGSPINEGDSIFMHYKMNTDRKTYIDILGVYCNRAECGVKISHDLFLNNEALRDPIRNDWGLHWGSKEGTTEPPWDVYREGEDEEEEDDE